MNAPDRIVPQSLPALTGIRGFAACWVVLFHVDGLLAPYLPGIGRVSFFRSGFRGVDLFFLLSGFVLMHANGQDFRTIRQTELTRFAILRFTRIYPLNTMVLCLIAALGRVLSRLSQGLSRTIYGPGICRDDDPVQSLADS